MTRKDFQAVAEALAVCLSNQPTLSAEVIDGIVNQFAVNIAHTNSHFKHKTFVEYTLNRVDSK